MSESWEDEHYKSWQRENARARQEKHEELFWSEIEDGIVSPTPQSTVDTKDWVPNHEWENMSFEEQLEALKRHFEKDI